MLVDSPNVLMLLSQILWLYCRQSRAILLSLTVLGFIYFTGAIFSPYLFLSFLFLYSNVLSTFFTISPTFTGLSEYVTARSFDQFEWPPYVDLPRTVSISLLLRYSPFSL